MLSRVVSNQHLVYSSWQKLGLACVLSCALAVAACGDDEEQPPPLDITDRLLTQADLPEYSAVDDFDWSNAEGVRDEGLGTSTIEASAQEAYEVVQDAGFKVGAGRMFQRSDSTAPPDYVFVQVLELDSESSARDVLAFSADDSERPCPETCAFVVTATDVDGIPESRGVTRLATDESIAETGPAGFEPGEIHRIAFTDGPFFYLIGTAHTPPSDDAAGMAQRLGETLYERVKGAPRE